MRRIRKRYRVLLLSAIVGALIVPVGYALSSDSAPPRSLAQLGARQSTAAAVVAAPVMAHAGTRAAASPAATDVHTVPDAAKLLLVGTSLFGLAAAVRKAR